MIVCLLDGLILLMVLQHVDSSSVGCVFKVHINSKIRFQVTINKSNNEMQWEYIRDITMSLKEKEPYAPFPIDFFMFYSQRKKHTQVVSVRVPGNLSSISGIHISL